MMQEMPCVVNAAPHDPEVQTSQVLQQGAVDGLKIAWRYKGQVAEKMLGGSDALASAGSVRHAHYFDLSKPATTPERVRTILKDSSEDLASVWTRVESLVKSFTEEQIASQAASVPILRIVFLGLGSGLWESHGLLSFLHRLHNLSRHSLVHCLVTMPKVVVDSAVRHCFDHAVRLSEFR